MTTTIEPPNLVHPHTRWWGAFSLYDYSEINPWTVAEHKRFWYVVNVSENKFSGGWTDRSIAEREATKRNSPAYSAG